MNVQSRCGQYLAIHGSVRVMQHDRGSSALLLLLLLLLHMFHLRWAGLDAVLCC